MPTVLTKPVTQTDGSKVTEFVDVTSTTAVTYTFPVSQSKLSIINEGEEDITVTVGSQSNVVVKRYETKEFTLAFTTFSIRSAVNSQAFKAIATVAAATLDASAFATKSELTSYETKANATATYATKSQITPLAVKTEVAATYQTIALAETKANAASVYLSKTAAESTYGKVKTVNSIAPDAAGNVTLPTA